MTTNAIEKEIIPFSLTIEKELLDKIRELANAEMRSVNKQVIYLVMKGMSCDKTEMGD